MSVQTPGAFNTCAANQPGADPRTPMQMLFVLPSKFTEARKAPQPTHSDVRSLRYLAWEQTIAVSSAYLRGKACLQFGCYQLLWRNQRTTQHFLPTEKAEG